MGMFDYIKCEMELPKEPKPPEVEWFQTKDTPTAQLWMDKWVIKQDGSLVKLGYRIEDHSDKNAEPGSFDSIVGCMTKVYEPENNEVVNFHGDISFGHFDTETKESWDYVARFTEGKCVKIWLHDCRIY